MKKKILGAVAAVALGLGMTLVTMSPASAHTPSASATCEALNVSAVYYETKPATQEVTEEVLVSPEVPHQPAVYGEPPLISPELPEISHTEYKFKHIITGKVKWVTDLDWNSGPGWDWGWYYTYETRVVIDQEAQPAVYGEAPLLTPEVPYQPAAYETVVVTPASPADSTPNTVVATIDGVEVENTEFGHNFSESYDFATAWEAHDWTVVITAWNDPDGSKGWTKTFSGTTTPCIPEKPSDEVFFDEWFDGEYDCSALDQEVPSVTQYRYVTTTLHPGARERRLGAGRRDRSRLLHGGAPSDGGRDRGPRRGMPGGADSRTGADQPACAAARAGGS